MTTMRAKLQVDSVRENKNEDGSTNNEQLHLHGVSASKYPEDGSDENNTFARFSPSVDFSITIANPALFGKFKAGDQFYADFTPVDKAAKSE